MFDNSMGEGGKLYEKVEIYGDWSGGTNNAIAAGWVKLTEIEPYDESKVKYYDKQGKPYFKKSTK